MKGTRTQLVAILVVMLGTLGLSSAAMADDHLRGVIMGRDADGAVIVRSDDATKVVVVLQEGTKVRESAGLRSTRVEAPSLISGLRIKAEGHYDATAHFVAEEVTYSRDDLKVALAIQAALVPTDLNVAANRAAIDTLSQQTDQRFAQGQQILSEQQRQIAANNEQIVATSGAVAAANTRISNLDDYSVLDMVTVYFRNGQSKVTSTYQAQLKDFAAKATSTNGYKISVEGFASAVGHPDTNQRLSALRATNVAAVLSQNGVAPTNMFVPAAMGTSDQVAPNKTAKQQAENRRVVVRLLQNRGTTGQ
jgi:outer membrane protein OmpA-like peptidoglycan-associated protein